MTVRTYYVCDINDKRIGESFNTHDAALEYLKSINGWHLHIKEFVKEVAMYTVTETKKDTMNRCAKCQRIPCNYIGDYFTQEVDTFLCFECRNIIMAEREQAATQPDNTEPRAEAKAINTVKKPATKVKPKPQTKSKAGTGKSKAAPKKKPNQSR